jgi:hypothetical protein
MKKLAISLILLSSLLFASGCAEKAQENSTNHQNIPNQNCAGAPRCKQRGMSAPALPITIFY